MGFIVDIEGGMLHYTNFAGYMTLCYVLFQDLLMCVEGVGGYQEGEGERIL